jgi:flagellar biosynthesis regulator FlaF
MYQLSYTEHFADNPKDCRDRERHALEHAAGLLRKAEAAGKGPADWDQSQADRFRRKR